MPVVDEVKKTLLFITLRVLLQEASPLWITALMPNSSALLLAQCWIKARSEDGVVFSKDPNCYQTQALVSHQMPTQLSGPTHPFSTAKC